eukprot:1184956-Rhodomonas_salina.1
MLGMWSRRWHVNQRTHEVGDDAAVSNRLCVPGANEILEHNLHALDPLLQVIELPSSDVRCVNLHRSHTRTVVCRRDLKESGRHALPNEQQFER